MGLSPLSTSEGLKKSSMRTLKPNNRGKGTKRCNHQYGCRQKPIEDGITAEFYKTLINELLEPMTILLNNIWLKEKQPQSHKNALIKLLFKKDDHRKLKNWRPISLLNIDYKVYKVLTARLRKVMGTITPVEQKCGVQGRRMTDVIRNINEIRNHNMNGYQC